jgi:hypothetical protein
MLGPLKHEEVVRMQSDVAREANDMQKAHKEVTRMLSKLHG